MEHPAQRRHRRGNFLEEAADRRPVGDIAGLREHPDAGSDEVFDAALRRCGVLRVQSISDLFYMAEVLSKQPRPRGPRLTILTNAGGPGVLATDALIAGGGKLAALSSDAEARLNALLPPHWSHANPIDILGDADPERYAKALEIAIDDPASDGLLVVLAPQGMSNPAEITMADRAPASTHSPTTPGTVWAGVTITARSTGSGKLFGLG